MKRIWVAIVSVALGLWFGYSLGYHDGKRSELAAWRGTEQIELNTDDDQLVAASQSSVPTRNGRIKVVQSSKRPKLRVYYSDPHVTTGYDWFGPPPLNAPDPRNLPIK